MLAVPVDAGPLGAWLEPFAAVLGGPAWRRALVLVAGALLAPGRRTVASALRAAGLGNAPGFANYHRVLSEGRWSGLALARQLLVFLVAAFALRGTVVVALDDTLERRWGRRIRARGDRAALNIGDSAYKCRTASAWAVAGMRSGVLRRGHGS